MGFRKMLFPIALAIVWVAMMAMAMVDFASFNAATAAAQAPRPAAAAPLRS